MSQLTDRYDDQTSRIEKLSNVGESITSILGHIAHQIRLHRDTPAILTELADKIESDATTTAAAVNANTPASEVAKAAARVSQLESENMKLKQQLADAQALAKASNKPSSTPPRMSEPTKNPHPEEKQ